MNSISEEKVEILTESRFLQDNRETSTARIV